MTEASLHVRIHDRPAALERLSGLLRRRGFAITRFSASHSNGGVIDLVIRVDESRTDRQRVQRELATLHDVCAIRIGGSQAFDTKELLRARLRSNGNADAAGTVEFVGTPAEVDDMLASLRADQSLVSYVRSGEVALPEIEEQPPTEGEP